MKPEMPQKPEAPQTHDVTRVHEKPIRYQKGFLILYADQGLVAIQPEAIVKVHETALRGRCTITLYFRPLMVVEQEVRHSIGAVLESLENTDR